MITPLTGRRFMGNWDTVFQSIMETQNELQVPGEIAEFGVFEGGNTLKLAQYGRKVWAFDTYEGIPKEDFDPEVDKDLPGKFTPQWSIADLFRGYPQVIPVKGRFAETLPTIAPSLKFCFVFLDCDLYSSHKQVLSWLPSHMSRNGVILFEDYYLLPAAKQAAEEFKLEQGFGDQGVPANLVVWKDSHV